MTSTSENPPVVSSSMATLLEAANEVIKEEREATDAQISQAGKELNEKIDQESQKVEPESSQVPSEQKTGDSGESKSESQ